MASGEAIEALELLDFWVGAGSAAWFGRDDAFDERCRAYVPLHERAAAGELEGWTSTAVGSLALILLMDQIPRNAFRGTARQYETDAKARAVAEASIGARHDLSQGWPVRNFYYLPLQHAEDLGVQERSLELYRRGGQQEFYYWALVHADAIRRFGRFPHRNAVLGRESTPEEDAYLASGGFGG